MSNLLEKASILTTPTAYNDGKLLSVKPVQTEESYNVDSTDFTVDGTSGNVYYKDTLSLAGTSGVATITFNHTVLQGTRSRVYIRNGADSGYVTTYTTSDFSQGQSLPNLTKQGDISVIVTFTDGLTFGFLAENGNEIQIQNFKAVKIIDGDFDFTRNSSATRVNEQGLVEDVASGLPRIDYTDGVGHILLEPQSTNLVTYSEDFTSNSNYVTNAPSGIFESGYLAPDGTNTATRINGFDGYYLLLNNLGSADARSMYVKSGNGQTGNVNLLDRNNHTSSLFEVTGEWKRIELVGVDSAFYIVDGRGANITLDDIIIWGLQQENLSYATSYIPTSGSTVTRLGETLNNSGSSDLINSTEGVLYAEISALANDNSTRVIVISDGTNANRVFIGYWTASNEIRALVKSGNVTQVFQGSNSYDILDLNKIAFKFKENDFALWINGVEVFTDTTGITFPIGTLTQLDFDSNSSAYFYGKVKCVAVFEEALTDEELTCLTTI